MPRFDHPDQFIKLNRKIIQSDQDVLIVIVGPERMGKSTIGYQIQKAYDPTFTTNSIYMTTPAFVEGARRSPRRRGLQCDETRASRRRAMSQENEELNQFLRENGGLNLFMTLLAPRDNAIDRTVIDDRARWVIEVPGPQEFGLPPTERPGIWILKEPRPWKSYDKYGNQIKAIRWTECGRWKFNPNTLADPEWAAYQQKKDDHMRARAEDPAEPEADSTRSSAHNSLRQLASMIRPVDADKTLPRPDTGTLP